MNDFHSAELEEALTSILLNQTSSITEYQLIVTLQNEPFTLFDPEALRDPLNLFRCHFILFHHLYRLADSFNYQQLGQLNIHTTCIELRPWAVGSNKLSEKDPLRQYYLDWSHFQKTDQQAVEQLLESFWQNMQRSERLDITPQNKQAALAEFGIATLTTPEQLKRLYRKLQHQHHPDKGGSGDKSKRLEHAYSLLKQCF
ncbi:DNA-J related domain-containing protein [Aliiglaciecola sp. LCG003]|uniref:DNA-J related domain-containing protein n=1 Tax=Aliiglaciecola sp. LCG003 TaxID=3053655 RepID=UPI00257322AA|nr:DNA-J related domain-containing protein [Aliiglaciecola sp. LCG003]WJG08139.1 DNA-J related domain-containing protein [Aliiglaciecola sp. LCG003]